MHRRRIGFRPLPFGTLYVLRTTVSAKLPYENRENYARVNGRHERIVYRRVQFLNNIRVELACINKKQSNDTTETIGFYFPFERLRRQRGVGVNAEQSMRVLIVIPIHCRPCAIYSHGRSTFWGGGAPHNDIFTLGGIDSTFWGDTRPFTRHAFTPYAEHEHYVCTITTFVLFQPYRAL